MWNNIIINKHFEDETDEYDEFNKQWNDNIYCSSFNIYTLFDEENRYKLNCDEYGSTGYIFYLFLELYNMKETNYRWRIVEPQYYLPNFNELFPIFKNQQNIKSNNYIFKSWINDTEDMILKYGEDPTCSLNRSSYWNICPTYAIIDDKYYLWMPNMWYCHEDAPYEAYENYDIRPSIITNNINSIDELMSQQYTSK